MPFKHAHVIDLTVGEQHHSDFHGERFGHERHVQASKVPGVEPGTIVAHTHHDADERLHEETGMLSHHLSKPSSQPRVTAPFDADEHDQESGFTGSVSTFVPEAVPAGRRNLDAE